VSCRRHWHGLRWQPHWPTSNGPWPTASTGRRRLISVGLFLRLVTPPPRYQKPPRPGRVPLVDIIVWTLFSWSPWRCWLSSARCGGGRDRRTPRDSTWLSGVTSQQCRLTSGALRTGGQVDTLTWQQDGLSVKVEGASSGVWQPLTLLQGIWPSRNWWPHVYRWTSDHQQRARRRAHSLGLPISLSVNQLAFIGQLDFTGSSTATAEEQ
jgi:hypothetical protein